MRKVCFLAGAALAFAPASAVYAQDAEAAAVVAMEDAADAMEEAADAMEDAAAAMESVTAPTCELRVFPTLEGQAQTTSMLSGFGMIGAIADAAKNKNRNISEGEYLKEALGPEFQKRALQSIDLVAELNLPEGTAIMFEEPIEDRGISTKSKTRLTDSNAPCYAELLVTQNLYQKKAIYGRSLNNRFIFKDFRDGLTETKMVKGRGGNGLSHFPPKTTDETEAAEADLLQAFTANFLEYSKRFN